MSAVDSVRELAGSMREIEHVTAAIASAIEQQGAATNEISHNVQLAANGTQALAENVSGVNAAIGATSRSAEQALAASQGVATAADRLIKEVKRFFAVLRQEEQKAA